MQTFMLKLKLQSFSHLMRRSWCWQRLKAGGERDDRGWDGWMASPTQWTWIWASSGRWWRTGKPAVHGVAESDMTEWLNDNKPFQMGFFHLAIPFKFLLHLFLIANFFLALNSILLCDSTTGFLFLSLLTLICYCLVDLLLICCCSVMSDSKEPHRL